MITTKTTLLDSIQHLKPCKDAAEWLEKQKSPTQAWRDCKRGDWMLWLIGKQITSEPWSEDRKPFLACALDCAETVKHLWHNKLIAESVAILRDWIDGTTTVESAKNAREHLYADYAAAAYVAAAVVDAADYAAAYAAAAVVDAADAADDARNKCANIVRKHYPQPPTIK